MTTELHELSERDVRQRELVPPAKLLKTAAIVIGVGAIGRQVALQLAAVGVPQLHVIDHDAVSVENLACQGYWPEDLGQPKVTATAQLCRLINPQVNIASHAARFSRSWAKDFPAAKHSVVAFCCVDSMSTRRLIWESLKHSVDLFIDGRMNAEVIRVIAAAPAGDEHYATTLFGDHERYGGSCTVRSTIYTASIAAGLMIGQFTRWLRVLPIERDVLLNLLSSELTVS